MVVNKTQYNIILSQAFNQANSIINSENFENIMDEYRQNNHLNHPLKIKLNNVEILLNKSVAQGIETIVNNLSQNKYLYSILITSLVEKIVHPYQDIRYAQKELSGGYSNRSTDQIHVTPFF